VCGVPGATSTAARADLAPPPAPASVRTEGEAPAPAHDHSDGLVIVLGIVLGVIALAWVCSRFGDSR